MCNRRRARSPACWTCPVRG
ncbi:hypothetical protein [Phenylobacterium deserti]